MPENIPGNIAELFFTSSVPPERPALLTRVGENPHVITRGRMEQMVRELSVGLSLLGIEPQERVAIFCENRPEWIISDLAIALTGAVSVPVYTTLGREDLWFILKDSGARAIITSARLAERLKEVRQTLPLLKRVIILDPDEDHPLEEDAIHFKDLLSLGREELERAPFRPRPAKGDELFSIVYSSGTTGRPRGVMLSHGNVISNIHAIKQAIRVNSADRYLSYLPLSHIFERTTHHFLIHAGCAICYARGFSFVGADMEFFRPTFMIGVPFVFERMKRRIEDHIEGLSPLRRFIVKKAIEYSRSPLWQTLARPVLRSIKRKVAPTIRFFVSGGAPLSPSTAEFFFAIGIPLFEGYGLTETSPVVSVNTPESYRIGTVGRPLKGVEVKIAEDGEVLVRGASVMKGYLNLPELTARTISNGWLHTGDTGYIDKDGFLTITGRKKDIIITSAGKNISPQKIENILRADPYIKDALLYGDRRPHLVALIIPDTERLPELARRLGIKGDVAECLKDERLYRFFEKRIREQLKGLSRFEQIHRFALIADDLSCERGELTPTMKLKRDAIAKRYHALIDSLY